MSVFDKLKFWKHEEEPIGEFGDLDAAFPTGGGPPFPTGIPESSSHQDFGSLTPMAYNQSSSPPPQVTITSPTPPYQVVQPQPLYQPVQQPMNKDVEIISLKLDAIKNTLDAINMRLERLEHIARGEEYPLKQGRF